MVSIFLFFVNINYKDTNDLVNYLNTEKEPFKILNLLVFKYKKGIVIKKML